MHQTHHLYCRIIAQQHDQQNLQKWRMCQGKLQQERLLVQQLETEAAVMQMQDHAQEFQDNAAYSDSDSQSPNKTEGAASHSPARAQGCQSQHLSLLGRRCSR